MFYCALLEAFVKRPEALPTGAKWAAVMKQVPRDANRSLGPDGATSDDDIILEETSTN
ncbi:hypothetical protein SAMN02745181_2625 [Rubritalea squalenifaciens DSM 18772]|uniref:Uncharacterized protein n=2 Tax=Rubritalea squalenifaciens TaxID=407226 RepID=A0A1M6M7F0_9BACT|nr:hypothetical protein SAMN02745181_2625 [Rubritalea squalenifaciens DSM 18772]